MIVSVHAMYPVVYSLIFLSTLPQEGTQPSDLQTYSLSRVMMATRDISNTAVAFAQAVPSSHYTHLCKRYLALGSLIFEIVRQKAGLDMNLVHQMTVDIDTCKKGVDALNGCLALHSTQRKVQSHEPPNEAAAKHQTAQQARAKVMGEITQLHTALVDKPAPNKRAPKGSRRASPKKPAAPRRQSRKASIAAAPKPTPAPNSDPDSSLTTLSSDNDVSGCSEVDVNFTANGLAAAAAFAAAAVVQEEADAEHSQTAEVGNDSSEQRDAADSSMLSTLEMVKEALARAPTSSSADAAIVEPYTRTERIVTAAMEEQQFKTPASSAKSAQSSSIGQTPVVSGEQSGWAGSQSSPTEGSTYARFGSYTYDVQPSKEAYILDNYDYARRQSMAPAPYHFGRAGSAPSSGLYPIEEQPYPEYAHAASGSTASYYALPRQDSLEPAAAAWAAYPSPVEQPRVASYATYDHKYKPSAYHDGQHSH